MRLWDRTYQLEKCRLRQVAAGFLIDVSVAAQKAGLPWTVCLGKSLWKSIVEPYPFVRSHEHLPLECLLNLLKARLDESPPDRVHLLQIPPTSAPSWLKTPYHLKLLVNRLRNATPSAIVLLPSDLFPMKRRGSSASLPTMPLFLLSEALHWLAIVARPTTRPIIADMIRMAAEIASGSPFAVEIAMHLKRLPSSFPRRLPDGLHETVLLTTLEETLAVLQAAADTHTSERVQSLQNNYRVIVSPLADIFRIIESLLLLASRVSAERSVRVRSFPVLLYLHSDLLGRLRRLETEIPPATLTEIREQILSLTLVLPPDDHSALFRLDEDCARLSGHLSKTTFRSSMSGSTLVWH